MGTDFRHEYKYLCSFGQSVVLRHRLDCLMKKDSHTVGDGSYLIRSIYFDDPYDECFFDNEDGTDPRAKYRLRIYNCDDSFIALERKAKKNTMTHKDAARVTKDMALLMMRGEIPPVTDDMPQILKRMLTDMRQRAMKPAVIGQYLRVPYVEKAGNVRVTLDTDIASSQAIDRFFEKDIPLRKILPENRCLLEVKWDSFFPTHLYSMLQLEQMQWTAFSKYYLCRKYNTGGFSL